MYGLKDAARMWYEKVVKVIRDLKGERSKLEPTMFYWSEKGKLIGIMCTHVDFCFGGTEKFLKEVIGGLKKKLRIGEEELSKFRYIGVNVQGDEEGVWMEQDRYIDSISAHIEGDFNDDRVEGR